MRTILKFTIPLSPVSKKNSQRILINKATGRPFIMPSAKYKTYEKEAAHYIPNTDKIERPVNVKCLFYMPTRRRVDKVNLEGAIHDVMVTVGLLEDDNRDIIAGTDGTRVLYDPKNPRTEVEITAMEGYEQWAKK